MKKKTATATIKVQTSTKPMVVARLMPTISMNVRNAPLVLPEVVVGTLEGWLDGVLITGTLDAALPIETRLNSFPDH